MNLMMLLEMAAQGFGDRVAVQNGDDTPHLLRALPGRRRRRRRSAKASGAEHVAVLDVSSLAVPVSLFASAWAGLPFVPLNYRLTGDELDALVARIAPSYLRDRRRAGAEPWPAATAPAWRPARSSSSWRAPGASRAAPSGRWTPTPSRSCSSPAARPARPRPPCCATSTWSPTSSARVEFGAAAEEDAALVSVPPYHVAGMAAIAELGLLGPAHRAAAELQRRGLARAGAPRARHQRLRGADHARAHRRRARGPGATRTCPRCARSPTAAARCRSR